MDKSKPQEIAEAFESYKLFLARIGIGLSKYLEDGFFKNYQEVHDKIHANKIINKDMKDSIVKLKLVSGEPSIGRIDATDGEVVIDILVPGVPNGTIAIELDDDCVIVSTQSEYRYSSPFEIRFYGDTLLFGRYESKMELGVLTIWIPILEEVDDNAPTKIFV